MPLFAYICKQCGAQAELLVAADAVVRCPDCGSAKFERQMSRFAAVVAQSHEPACSGCAMAEQGRCPSQSGCMS